MRQLEAAVGYLEMHAEAPGRLVGDTAGAPRALTHEQHAIVSTDLKPDEVMIVRAFAGTG